MRQLLLQGVGAQKHDHDALEATLAHQLAADRDRPALADPPRNRRTDPNLVCRARRLSKEMVAAGMMLPFARGRRTFDGFARRVEHHDVRNDSVRVGAEGAADRRLEGPRAFPVSITHVPQSGSDAVQQLLGLTRQGIGQLPGMLRSASASTSCRKPALERSTWIQ